MSSVQRLFIGRHGRVTTDQSLSPEGFDDAHSMAGQLRDIGLSDRSIIMSSLAKRTLQTAGVIKDDLHIPTLVRSAFIGKVGERPQPVEDVHGFIGKILAACAVNHTESDVVVITHQPLVEAVSEVSLTYGQVFAVPEGWRNPCFEPSFAICLEQPDLW